MTFDEWLIELQYTATVPLRECWYTARSTTLDRILCIIEHMESYALCRNTQNGKDCAQFARLIRDEITKEMNYG